MPDSPGGDVVTYQVDWNDTITFVNDTFVRFAWQNEALDIVPSSVVGHSLWEFVVGEDVRHLWALLLNKVRISDAPIIVPFRCDSPTLRRFLRLEISHRMHGTIDLNSLLISTEERPHVALLDPGTPRGDNSILVCSYCKKAQGDDIDWVEIEDAVVRLGLFQATELPQVEHSVCPACDAMIRHEVTA